MMVVCERPITDDPYGYSLASLGAREYKQRLSAWACTHAMFQLTVSGRLSRHQLWPKIGTKGAPRQFFLRFGLRLSVEPWRESPDYKARNGQ